MQDDGDISAYWLLAVLVFAAIITTPILAGWVT